MFSLICLAALLFRLSLSIPYKYTCVFCSVPSGSNSVLSCGPNHGPCLSSQRSNALEYRMSVWSAVKQMPERNRCSHLARLASPQLVIPISLFPTTSLISSHLDVHASCQRLSRFERTKKPYDVAFTAYQETVVFDVSEQEGGGPHQCLRGRGRTDN